MLPVHHLLSLRLMLYPPAVGDQLMLPADPDSDLEQLIRGGPFELSLAADRLGNNLFGIQSDFQVCICFFMS